MRGRRKGSYLVSSEIRWHLIQIYLNMGGRVAALECKELGLKSRYAECITYRSGYRRGVYRPCENRMDTKRKDKLWERARRVGKICV